MKKLMSVVAIGLVASLGAVEFKGLVKAEEVHGRSGIGNFLSKVESGKDVTVAYLGGSITAMSGWRNLTSDWIRKTYGVKVNEIHAAIGGTGSGLGVYRVGHDALDANPDLLFVEFATNDGSTQPEYIWKCMEGIARQAWKKNPQMDVVFTYTITASMMNDYGKGICPRAASAMEQLADYYGIPSIGFGPRVAAEVAAGRLVMSMKDAEKETAVPTETPDRDKAINAALAKEGKILFAKDGVHPAMSGHAFYLQSITNGFAKMKGLAPKDHKVDLAAAPFVEGNLENAKMVALPESSLIGSWKRLPADNEQMKRFSNRCGQIWLASKPGDKIKFKFNGSSCKLYDLLGPDCGQVWLTIDGKRINQKPYVRFDSYCTYYRLATLNIYEGKPGVHEVEIEVDKDQPSRQSVAFRLKNPEKELAEPKYQGTTFWPSQILLDGDLCD